MEKFSYSDEEILAAAELYPSLWVLKYAIKNEVGVPIEFTKRRFLKDIYDDLSPRQAILKPPQIGMTVMNVLKTFYVAKKHRRQTIYTLPTDGDIKDMVGGSFNRIIAQNPILLDWVKDKDTIEQKAVGDSMVFFRGTWTSRAAMMVPAGLLVHDEIDASDPDTINQYQTRLQAQEDGGWTWVFSHPSLSNHGVDIYWQQSDMKEWYITCPHCNEEQILTWPDSIDPERKCYQCRECKGEIENHVRINGRWKNKYGVAWDAQPLKGTVSGWHVSQLMLYNKSAEDILNAFNDPQKDKQYFYNYVLGLPYIGSDDRIEPEVVLRNCEDVVNPQTSRVIIGADTGHGIHFSLMNNEGVFYYEHATLAQYKDPYDRIEEMLKKYQRSIAMFDQGGDLIGVRKLQAKYPGRVFLCWYRKDRKTVDLATWGQHEEYGKVIIDRNRLMTLIIEQMRDTGRIRLNGSKEEWEEWASHFGYIYREQIKTKEMKDKDDRSLYSNEYVWKRNGPDHFVHTLMYAYVGLQKFGGGEAAIITGDKLFNVPTGMTTDQNNYIPPTAFSNSEYQIEL
jgi:hypothetical protein